MTSTKANNFSLLGLRFSLCVRKWAVSKAKEEIFCRPIDWERVLFTLLQKYNLDNFIILKLIFFREFTQS